MKNDNEELFYIRDSRSDVGSSAMFWMNDGAGYTSDLSKAWKVSREKAVSQHNCRETDIPVRCDLADAFSYRAVDMQKLPKPSISDGMNYLVWVGDYDGNNILFAGDRGASYDLKFIEPVSAEKAREVLNRKKNTIVSYPAEAIDGIARHVVCASYVATRKVLRKAKIKMNPALRAKREPSGKYRGNCPTCGRVTWDYNPHEVAYCKYHGGINYD